MKTQAFLQIPVEISQYVFDNDMVKSFGIYLYLKMHCSGKVHQNSPVFQTMRRALGMKDSRTFDKHLNVLLLENWVGFNPLSGYYFIRGFHYVRGKYHFKSRQATKFDIEDFDNLQVYLFAVCLCAIIRRQHYFWEVKRRKYRAVTKQTDVTNHSRVFSKNSPKPPYYGLSNFMIAKQLRRYSKTRACELKMAAAKLGYLGLVQHDHEIMVITKRDYRLRPALEAQYPGLKGKIRFETIVVKQGNQKIRKIRVFRQLHDEIIPKIQFKSVAKFNNLQLSDLVKREFKLISLAAAA